jgi:hypothetical protein
LLRGHLISRLDQGLLCEITRHEQVCDAIMVRRRQIETKTLGLCGEELVRQLDQDPGTVAGFRIRTHSATMFKITENFQTVFDDFAAALIAD